MSSEVAASVGNAFLQVIESIVSDRLNTISDISLLHDRDRRIFDEANGSLPETVSATVHDSVIQQTKRRPNSDAMTSWDGNLTYTQLDKLSSSLAEHLISLNVGSQVRIVPICSEKSLWAVVSMLAVLKTGAVFVCLPINHPIQRLETILREIEAPMILTSTTQGGRFLNSALSIICLSSGFLHNLPTPSRQLPKVDPEDTVFLMFTSGSTGRPKGILISHQSLCSSAAAHGQRWDIDSQSRVFQYAAFTHDVSITDVFTTLIRGGCVCIPSEEQRMDDIAGAMRNMRVNWCFLTPSVADLLQPEEVPSLRTLVLGGEAATIENINCWAHAVKLIICYGPAECSVYATGTDSVLKTSDPTNIGRPIGCRVWIVDQSDHRSLLPLGAVGEILIEGPGVGSGYFNDPERTLKSFVQDLPWTKSKCYRTGDL